ncbi:SDR family NAD(P)-dependent oxidoreductase, partial [Sinorhizobium meliloti]|uniref:SDR family NAD(P)-dependent oxidoreductase n=1 Tax=Rhizobium meliloti TaxID=382 RepID=UPI001F3361D5
MFELTGRKALVTGASGAIGGAIARVLHAQGAIVGLHGTQIEKLETLATELGDRVKLFPANLANRDEVKALGQRAEADLEGVDILVNNAGITKDGLFLHMADPDWDIVLEVNRDCQEFCAVGHDDEKERIITWLSRKNFWTSSWL